MGRRKKQSERYRPTLLTEAYSFEEIEKMRELKRKAVELFGKGKFVCDRCGSDAFSVYAANGDVTTMKKCTNPDCKCSNATRRKGWTDYLTSLHTYQHEL